MKLRDYQQKAIDDLYRWFADGNKGNPCLELPTGSGKSHIIAALCKDAIQNWPETRILMLTHVKELIEQNAQRMREHWPNAPLGIYSAGIGKRQLDEPITFGGIQSLRGKEDRIGFVDLIIIDEAHLVGHRDTGGYRELITKLHEINPSLRVIGLTATPYRLGHGMITDKPAIFSDIISPVSIEQLIFQGHLSILRSKTTSSKLDVSGVHKRGGEFIESELHAAVDQASITAGVVREVIEKAGDRKSWLFFCAGISHAEHVCEELQSSGISAACVTGNTPKKERESILSRFKRGELRALTNANVLTTGFDHPDIDLIAMLRPTLSPGLYVQMAGRGMRIKSHTDHCLVLDFAGVVATHGPITAVRTPTGKGDKTGEAPVKVCDVCAELCPLSARTCPACGAPFPEPKRDSLKLKLHDDDIMGLDGEEMEVKEWVWVKHTSRTSGKEMLLCKYYGRNISDPPVSEYHTILHDGIAGEKARRNLQRIIKSAGSVNYLAENFNGDLMPLVEFMKYLPPPSTIKYLKDGKFYKIINRRWENVKASGAANCA
jgi:DNA repair protein RadD